ncbi:helix-turn-helix domain-containing protein [Candidatus Acetothermia bacterium]|nr:helix-turn-helix domain-containing protein [Candidatus Acetothermia bacterium]
MITITQDMLHYWKVVRPLLSIRSERDYDRGIEQLNALIDEMGTDENHPLSDLLDILGVVIRAYEEKHQPIPKSSGAQVLRFLMEQHGLTQADLPEIGSQGVVSEILSGKRELNVRQVRALAKRFHVSPAAFI